MNSSNLFDFAGSRMMLSEPVSLNDYWQEDGRITCTFTRSEEGWTVKVDKPGEPQYITQVPLDLFKLPKRKKRKVISSTDFISKRAKRRNRRG